MQTRTAPETAAVVSKSTKTESGADTVTPGGGAPATEDRPAKVVPPAAETASNVAWAANVRVVCVRLSQYEDGPLATVTIAPSAVRIDAKAFRPNTPAGAAGNARPAVPSNVKTPSGRKPGTTASIRPANVAVPPTQPACSHTPPPDASNAKLESGSSATDRTSRSATHRRRLRRP
jgi:hypothetical protein